MLPEKLKQKIEYSVDIFGLTRQLSISTNACKKEGINYNKNSIKTYKNYS